MTPRRYPARAAAALRRQRLRRAHLRNRLVSAAPARDRLVGGVAGRAARHVHGRHVPGQPAAAALRLRRHHPLRVYAWLELGIGAIGIARAVRHAAGVRRLHGVGRHRHRRPPAARRRGGDLPAAADDADGRDAAGDVALGRTTPDGVSWLGFFYGGNTGGAVLGSLLAGFYLLRVHDTAIATYVAVGAQRAGRRASRWPIARATPSPSATDADRRRGHVDSRAGRVGGLRRRSRCRADRALGRGDLDAHAVAPDRRDGLHVLADPRRVPVRPRHRQQRRLGAGAQRSTRPRIALGWCQMLLCGAIVWAAYMLHAVAAVLAGQPVALDQPVVQLPARSRAPHVGRCCRRDPVGRELPARARVGGDARPGSGAPGRRRLRRQHRRRDRRRARRRACCSSPGSAASARSSC